MILIASEFQPGKYSNKKRNRSASSNKKSSSQKKGRKEASTKAVTTSPVQNIEIESKLSDPEMPIASENENAAVEDSPLGASTAPPPKAHSLGNRESVHHGKGKKRPKAAPSDASSSSESEAPPRKAHSLGNRESVHHGKGKKRPKAAPSDASSSSESDMSSTSSSANSHSMDMNALMCYELGSAQSRMNVSEESNAALRLQQRNREDKDRFFNEFLSTHRFHKTSKKKRKHHSHH